MKRSPQLPLPLKPPKPPSVRVSHFSCCARMPDLTFCLEPAFYTDVHRGGFVCDEHRPSQEERRAACYSRVRREMDPGLNNR